MHYILDENKKPVKVELIEWAKWFEENRILKHTDLCNGNVRVSSVFVGIEQDAGMFETATLYKGNILKGELETIITRCDTYKKCLKNHEVAIKNVENLEFPE